MRNFAVGRSRKRLRTDQNLRCLSICSHIPAPIRGERNRGKWPLVLSDCGPASLTCAQKVVLMGGHRLWIQRSVDDSFTWDACRSVSPRSLWKCLISDAISLGGSANGGLTPSSDAKGDQPMSRSSSITHDYKMGRNGILDELTHPTIPIGHSGDPKLRNLDVARYPTNRIHIPLIRWGAFLIRQTPITKIL